MAQPPRLAVAVLLLAACGGHDRPAVDTPTEPGQCTTDPAVAETRRPKPAGTGCGELTALTDACNAGDPDACDRTAGCELLEALGAPLADDVVARVRAATRVACDAGITEACLVRVGVVVESGAPLPDDHCADLRRACQLGDESGCFDCGNTGCD